MVQIEKSPIEEGLTKEAIEKRELVRRQKELNFERRQVEQEREEVQKETTKLKINYKMWLVVLLVALSIFTLLYLFKLL